MMEGILGQIANPQMANITGALDARQKRIDDQNKALARIAMGREIAKALPGLQEGSGFKTLAENDPQMFAVTAKALGIPLNDSERFNQFSNDVSQLYTLASADPNQAYAHAQQLIAQRKEQGQDTTQLDKWVQAMNEDPMKAVTSLFVMHRSINPGKDDSMNEYQRESLKLKREGMERGVGAGSESVQSAKILEDGTVVQVMKSGGTRVVDAEGSELSGKSRATAVRQANEYGIDVQSSRAGGRTEASEVSKGIVGNLKDFSDQGVAAAQSVPVMKRALSLLEQVETGGFDKAAIVAKQKFGIESGDEGELTYLLAKNVLGQLKETFGAAFTAAEGDRLEEIEASLGRSPAANKRIIKNALQIAEKKANRGKTAAEKMGNEFVASDIDSYMNMTLGDEQEPGSTKQQSLEDLLSKY
jgi:hypothetical protein